MNSCDTLMLYVEKHAHSSIYMKLQVYLYKCIYINYIYTMKLQPNAVVAM